MNRVLYLPLVCFLLSCEDKQEKDCAGIENGGAIIDDCGMCVGGTTGLLINFAMDCNNECGGSELEDECRVCGGNNECIGCTDSTACNFDNTSTIDDNTCTYPLENYDCVGDCIVEVDCAGVCGGNAMVDICGVCQGDNSICTGCTDSTALNYDVLATNDDGSCEYTLTVSDSNEMYSLSITISNTTTNHSTPVQFSTIVTRHSPYIIRSDSRVIGYWSIYSLTIDGDTVNVSQFPTDYEFYSDQTFDKIEMSSIGGETIYSNGEWTADMIAGTLTTSLQGVETIINFTFDHEGPIIPLNGFMIWDYEKDGHAYHKVLQKTEFTDPDLIAEPESYLSIAATGGIIEGITVPSFFDILIALPNEINSTYEVLGSFVPSFYYSAGNILVTLNSNNYSLINLTVAITIE
jgi:hypothetical protein